MADEPKKAPPGKPQLAIKLEDHMARGAYANVVFLHSNDAEFVLDFIFMEPQRRGGQVVSRIVTNPRTAKRLLQGLGEAVRVFEERFGEIPTADGGPGQGTYH